MTKVLIPTKLNSIAAKILENKDFKIVQNTEKDIKELARENSDSNVLIVRSNKIDKEIIDLLPNLNLIVRAGAGYNTIDIHHARRKNIDVMNTPGANSNAVAEEVIALYLAVYRHIIKGDTSVREGLWEKKQLMGREITGKTLGLIGLGNIGQLVVERLKGFNVNVLAYDPFISSERANELEVQLSSMEEVFQNSDCISLHIPENEDTKGIINNNLFKLMKPDSVLINCARAGLINEDDLREAKKEKNIKFCNDVYPQDAPGKKSVEDIADIMMPHLGASTYEANYNAAQRAAEQTIDYYNKGITKYVVNKLVPDELDEKYQKLANLITKIARAYLGTQGNSPFEIQTTFYGKLNKYADWMLAPILNGISSNYDPVSIASNPGEFLNSSGIRIKHREPEEDKKYGDSMTIDLLAGDESTINKVSIRGTLAENNFMISRINNYNQLYLDPTGNNLFIEYEDHPGVIGKIATILGSHNININDIRAPQDTQKRRALQVIKTNMEVPPNIVEEIKNSVKSENVFFIKLNNN